MEHHNHSHTSAPSNESSKHQPAQHTHEHTSAGDHAHGHTEHDEHAGHSVAV